MLARRSGAFIGLLARAATVIGIVVSEADPVSTLIGDALRARASWDTVEDETRSPGTGGGEVRRRPGFELRTFEELHLHLSGIGAHFTAVDAIVFVSKHAGESGPLLSTHFPGNIATAEYGGDPRSVPRAATGLLAPLYHGLRERAPPGYDVAIECTHHGPSAVGIPAVFVEVGSGPAQWRDEAAADAVAAAVLALEKAAPLADRAVAGFGGGHYAPRCERVLRETGWAVGHIAADWSLDDLDPSDSEAVVAMVLSRSRTQLALLDGERPRVRAAVEAAGGRVVGERWLRAMDGVPPETIAAIEASLGGVAEGTRTGTAAPEAGVDLRRIDLPDALVDALNAADPTSAIDALETRVIAYETAENGNRMASGILLAVDDDVDPLLTDLVAVLDDAYAEARLEEDAIVLAKRAFDPASAAELGIPEGPAYGRLAAGESVVVDGEEIDPAAVLTVREERIPRPE